jgi:hypothetical protein
MHVGLMLMWRLRERRVAIVFDVACFINETVNSGLDSSPDHFQIGNWVDIPSRLKID